MEAGEWMSLTRQGLGQQHKQHHQIYQIQQQLVQKNVSHHGFHGGGVHPASSTGLMDNFEEIGLIPSIVAPGLSTISQPPAIVYRPIRPSDLEVLREIHEALFPIKYEMDFFLNVVHGRGILSWAAIDTSRSDCQGDELVGFVTARVVKVTESEEADLLGYEVFNMERTLIYVLTLGVVKSYRHHGIASALILEVIEYASSLPTCRAVYLHVISYNRSAILFYKKNSFQSLRRLINFYYINGHHYDAYLYIYYVNGGRSPCSALYPFLSNIIDLLSAATTFIRSLLTSVVSRFSRNVDAAVQWTRMEKYLEV
ncbi:hypothetical protein O6H91_20G035200 [Diphasiastrum complanatum]|uniref:Uncharacterized protein n=1 Tax=Diphasiastrum complanatum TaxID=34168 RepID=A0ACC2AP74_DIPCM|nr:hypothetical protein O6H91_20G035200 [Diphasiastrum complanatum]